MLRAVSTHVFLRRRLCTSLLETLASTGAQGAEIYAARQHFDYTSRTDVREVADWFRDHSLQPLSLHAPQFGDLEMGRTGAASVNVIHVEKSRRIDAMDEVKRALETAEQIPFSYLILHLGDRNDAWSPRTLEHSVTAIEHLRAFAAPLGVKLLLENLQSEATQPEHLAEVLSVGHFRDVGICFDLGHAHLNGGMQAAMDILAPHIRSVHVHDNAGDRDSHLWPGDGTIAWPQTMNALAALPHSPAQVVELHPSYDAAAASINPEVAEPEIFPDFVQDMQETFAWLAECAATETARAGQRE